MIFVYQQLSRRFNRAFYAGCCFLIFVSCASTVKSQTQTASSRTAPADNPAVVSECRSAALPPQFAAAGRLTKRQIDECTLSGEEKREIAVALDLLRHPELARASKPDKPNVRLPRRVLKKLIEQRPAFTETPEQIEAYREMLPARFKERLLPEEAVLANLTKLTVSDRVTVVAANTQFSIAVHLMLALGYACGQPATSTELATSINTSGSFVRRILAKLSKANLVSTTTGKSGSCQLAKQPADILLSEIYRAVDAPQTFAIHRYPVQNSCLVSCNIEAVMNNVLQRAQNSFEASLAQTTLAELIAEIRIT